ncbi:MAG: hypothetical protein GWN99_06110 [Gemmatimonadetes bacterium]|uniref:Uncharacterized protein n=1 Tax=Candidatus Kutchimonas denitrificans TaxID=3056748 RepID=A0AAE4ZBK3_9BACT|nr:hypothetical protein [Gemmatimonadota bacterium]NIR76197.1 hypothetical protein [Candidatus Kutchimonas denitrificans]NIS00637.1 hypothetical protein [Gemmatimonadota bacterium]NIT66782.1 hypothetical protein [Gemmatimonadota bacterium]NIV23381.1 hypothetical protein [Gemmatimonadota bacterium]
MSDSLRFVTAVLAAAALGGVAACVGERSDDEAAGDDVPAVEFPEDYPKGRAGVDTAAPVDYQVFDSVVHEEDPRKVEFRVLALSSANRSSLSKTLRLVLDSIGRADSALVAARGVIYVYDPTAPRRGNVVPRLWGVWVPGVGWDSATAESREEPHVVYTYDVPSQGTPPGERE